MRSTPVWAISFSLATTKEMSSLARHCFIFHQVLRCFTSLGILLHLNVGHDLLRSRGFPIQRSTDQRLLGTSPKLIAAKLRPSSPFRVKASTICSLNFLLGNLKTTFFFLIPTSKKRNESLLSFRPNIVGTKVIVLSLTQRNNLYILICSR